jgi:hypothetical protein
VSERGKLLLVLGMHRSGTSAVTGMLADHGVELGPAREKRNAFNPRGNREILALRRVHERILDRAGGSWYEPPDEVEVTDADRSERDAVLAGIEGDVIALKDPRMLFAMELWRELDPLKIGVIRNPVAVRRSLERRASEGMGPVLVPAAWEALWRRYNRSLLNEAERAGPFPVVDFDRVADIDGQVRAALHAHGIEPTGEASSFDSSLLTAGGAAEDWRAEAEAASVEMWERLQDLAAQGGRGAPL